MSGPDRAGLALWPIRYKPKDDELLSSWLIRLAHGMGLKVQTLCNLEFGNRRQVWNRDIDRLGPPWLLETLSRRTGTPLHVVQRTTLRPYEGILYRQYKYSGVLPWVLGLQMYHRVWQGNGLQYCPACLAEDETCYYRRSWRLALNTICLRHRCLLLDRCPDCDAGVAFIRTELGRPDIDEFPGLSTCHACSRDLRQASSSAPSCLDGEAAQWLTDLWRNVEAGRIDNECLDSIEVLHVVCSLLTRRRPALHLAEYLCDVLGADRLSPTTRRTPIESRGVAERHQLLQMAAWMAVDLPERLAEALGQRAFRFNHLLRDFRHLPASYRAVVEALPR